MIRFWPATASDVAAQVDQLTGVLLAICGAILLLVGCLLLGFSIRYRRGSSAKRGALPEIVSREVEVGWTAATLFLALFLFAWATGMELRANPPQPDAIEVHVLARQWMWKTRHANGAQEIDALHVPRGEQVRLLMTSQDVIHSFFVPAFRAKQDVLPGRLTELRFTATETGTYNLFCAEYCGTLHARMGGTVTVMEPEDFARWLAVQPRGDDLAREGAALFVSLGCAGCHGDRRGGSATVRAPKLEGVYNSPVPLQDGRVVTADEAYLRDSILQPRRDVVAGFPNVMPSFAGLVHEEEMQRLLAYLRSLKDAP
ncbi:cytochrome c oxidase subunit II [Pararoseomonas indoligenes]|uniref:cytochrome-c oxidase n=1 Tax=Roseomonas indoligenes TaxID=2820811 RepID=A0A940S3Y3_9PROT|nr:cytochrome c oxidase subunit II [Pararoseomonas indoligenes]MBP0491414.1 cytochrome c oxidase subunit II [Pararoseomonas indoligenes]